MVDERIFDIDPKTNKKIHKHHHEDSLIIIDPNAAAA
jgi:hypothetical protein